MMLRMTQTSLILLLVTVVVNGKTRSQGVPTIPCDLACSNNGRCVVANATFVELDSDTDQAPAFHTANNDGQYCLCPVGWTGFNCDTIFESCGVNGQNCLNGGKCVKGLIDDFGNSQNLCDCSNATDDKGNPTVGKFCEQPFIKFCDKQAQVFCVNGGKCNLNYPDEGLPCDCPSGTEGIHCEFKSDAVPNCTLSCQNGGECVLGVVSANQLDGSSYFLENDHVQYQRCICTDNYEGVLCEVEKNPCGDEFCYNGGTCVGNNTCDCSTANNDAYEGVYCQLPKADIVDNTANTTQQVPCGSDQFCFNGGVCDLKMINGEIKHMCDCSTADKDGFTYIGQYCQYLSTECGEDCQKNKTGLDTVACGNQFCFNGAACATTKVDGQTKHHCNCTKGYAGTYCEYKAVDCSLKCDHGGVCVQGGLADEDVDDAFDAWNASVSYEHCLCPTGFQGKLCEIQNEKKQTNETCGDGQQCFNGGTCVKATINGKARYHCDCSSTVTSDTAYAGRYCQYKASQICSRDTSDKALLFCVNGGVCIGDGYEGCACPGSFSGFSCEFEKAVAGTTTTTITQGQSAGSGTTTTTTISGGSSAGDGVTATSSPQRTDPPVATTSSSISKNPLVDLCTTGNVPPGQPRFFCINGGSCKSYVPAGQPHPGCECLSGWEGPHCEQKSKVDEAPKKALVAVKVLLILVTLAVLGIVAYYSYKRLSLRKRRFTAEERRRLKDEVNIAPHRESFTDFSSKVKSSSDPIASAVATLPGAPEVYIGPPRDEDGHELHNVEII